MQHRQPVRRQGHPGAAGIGLPYEGLHGVDGSVRLAGLPASTPSSERAVLGPLGV
ncbi:hypothetical protein [Streptomyces sp. NPDC001315]|uniref:hypothetical protein n=1 Tax=Streptomyces sp. NPDC001315 TaxID=3364562 RepID=UPI0036CE671F